MDIKTQKDTAMGDTTFGKEAVRLARADYEAAGAVDPADQEFGPLMRASRRGMLFTTFLLLLLPLLLIGGTAIIVRR